MWKSGKYAFDLLIPPGYPSNNLTRKAWRWQFGWSLNGELFWLTIEEATGNLDAQIWHAKPKEETWDAR
jgi:hypothetical protein